MMMRGTHDMSLVILSILIAMFASFTALSLATRMRASTGWMRHMWVTAAAIALGGGIWSMHFVAMLAFTMPGMVMRYDLALTLLSLALALGFTWAGFWMLSRSAMAPLRVAVAGLLISAGVLGMHYLGMAAMHMAATLRYDPFWLLLSVLIAVGAATAAMWLAARDHQLSHRLVAAAILGVAIAGMHYAVMREAIFTAKTGLTMTGGGGNL